jgi:hypothetical protein
MIYKEYKDRVDKLDLETIAIDFINNKSSGKCQRIFGKNKIAKHKICFAGKKILLLPRIFEPCGMPEYIFHRQQQAIS